MINFQLMYLSRLHMKKARIKKGAMSKGGAYEINLSAKFKEYLPVSLKKAIKEFIINDASASKTH